LRLERKFKTLSFKYKQKREYAQLFHLGLNKKKEMKKKMRRKQECAQYFQLELNKTKGKKEVAVNFTG
jgi:hypothetical protein